MPGLDSIPGGGAEILDDEVRYKIARLKCLTDDWLNVHRTAHKLGMRTTATMMFGVGETFEHRINHFQASTICRKRLADSPRSSLGPSSRRTPPSADAAGTKPLRSNI